YVAVLSDEPARLAAVVGDPGWIEAAIRLLGAERILGDLGSAAAALPNDATVGAMLAALRAQAHQLRAADPLSQPGYILRQLWLQTAEFGEDGLANQFRTRLQAESAQGLIPFFTTRRSNRALLRELARYEGRIQAVVALPEGRLASVDLGGRLLVWNT